MRLVSILCLVILVTAKRTNKCDSGIHVRGKFHRKTVLTNGLNRPYQLSFYEHRIYFSYNVGPDDEDNFEIGYVTKNNHIPVTVNVTNGFATAVDHKDKVVYFGGSTGIYAHNVETGKTKHVVKGRNIWDLFFKHELLYFIEFPSLRLHEYNRTTENTTLYDGIKEKIYQFVIDADDDKFITTKDGLFQIKKNGTEDRIFYEEPKQFRCMEVDNKGVVHFCGTNGIYVANKMNHTLHEIAHVKNIFGLTFDNDNNIIYSNPHEIVKLLPDKCV